MAKAPMSFWDRITTWSAQPVWCMACVIIEVGLLSWAFHALPPLGSLIAMTVSGIAFGFTARIFARNVWADMTNQPIPIHERIRLWQQYERRASRYQGPSRRA